jgi:DNA-binding MarR family transcriptional regulator
MPQEDSKQYYLHFINFLLQQKRVLIEIGIRYDLTAMQTLSLLLLDRPLHMHSLSVAFSCDASNVTGIVDGMRHKQLVQRLENPSDRRVRMIGLSPKGTELRNKILAELVDETDPNPIFQKLSSGELKTFFELIGKVTQ